MAHNLRKEIKIFDNNEAKGDTHCQHRHCNHSDSEESSDEDSIKHTLRPYDRYQGFAVYWDYILNLPKQDFPQESSIQLIYGIYNKGGTTSFPPHIVRHSKVMHTTHPSYSQAIFGENHLIKSEKLLADPNNLLIIEVQCLIRKDQFKGFIPLKNRMEAADQ